VQLGVGGIEAHLAPFGLAGPAIAAGFPDEGSFFLGVRAMEKLYANRATPEGCDPPDQPVCEAAGGRLVWS
jgi:hypothetical protein